MEETSISQTTMRNMEEAEEIVDDGLVLQTVALLESAKTHAHRFTKAAMLQPSAVH